MPQRLPGNSQHPCQLFLETLEERWVLSGSIEGPFVPIAPPLPLVQVATTLLENIDQAIQRYSRASQEAVPSPTISLSLSNPSGFDKTLLLDEVNDLFAPNAGLPFTSTEMLTHSTLFEDGFATSKVSAEVTTAAPEETAIDHAILQKLDLENGTLLSALNPLTPHSFTGLSPLGDKEFASALETLGSDNPPSSDSEIADRINAVFKDIADGLPGNLPEFFAQPPPRPDRPDGDEFFAIPPPLLQQTVTCQHLSQDDCSQFHPEQLFQLSRLGPEAAAPVNEVVKVTSSLATVGDKLGEDWFGSLDVETSPLSTSHLIGLADFLVVPESSTTEVLFQAAPLLQGWLQAEGNLVDLDQAFRDFLKEVSQLPQEMRAWVGNHGKLSWALAGTAIALTFLDQAQRWRRAQLRQQRLIQDIDQPHPLGDLIV